MSNWMDEMDDAAEMLTDFQERFEQRHPMIYLVAECIRSVVEGILWGTLITFWICWITGRFN
jgi:hypothetical protein